MSETVVNEGTTITRELILDSIQQSERWYPRLEQLRGEGRGDEVDQFLDLGISVYRQMESAASDWQALLPHSKEAADKIKAIWVISGPGTYFSGKKDDRYKDKPWAFYSNRIRVNKALEVGRLVAELSSGAKLSGNWLRDEDVIKSRGPLIIYNGNGAENISLHEAIATPWLRLPSDKFYPRSKFFIIDAPIDNTADNINTFRFPPNFAHAVGDELGVVVHAAQATRFLYMFNQLKKGFPKEVSLRMFPLATPESGAIEYPVQELRALVYYHFFADPPIAASEPYPFLLPDRTSAP